MDGTLRMGLPSIEAILTHSRDFKGNSLVPYMLFYGAAQRVLSIDFMH